MKSAGEGRGRTAVRRSKKKDNPTGGHLIDAAA